MGKLIDIGKEERGRRQKIATTSSDGQSVPVSCDCCTAVDDSAAKKDAVENTPKKSLDDIVEVQQKELVIIGAGPHALTLVLRLLEPEADLLSDKERHFQSDSNNRMRPLPQVRNHIKKLMKGPSAVYKQKKKQAKKKDKDASSADDPPPLSLERLKQNVMVIDGSAASRDDGIHGWMAGWKHNFETLNISQLRSPISAHADPYDHRALEFYGPHVGRDSELIPFRTMTRPKCRSDFNGPYNAPSTSIFNDFHRQLICGYGVQNMVTPGTVDNIRCTGSTNANGLPLFELSVLDSNGQVSHIIQTPRVVCAVGPVYKASIPQPLQSPVAMDPWQVPNRILQPHQIIPYLANNNTKDNTSSSSSNKQSILIVGGGVTSAHLALTVSCHCHHWCESVTFIQRSKQLERQFDVEDSWMGPVRGKHLEQFWNLSNKERVEKLKTERKGGSIHPEVALMLKNVASKKKSSSRAQLVLQEETEIMDVQYDIHSDKLLVSMDDGLDPQSFDMIWLATGFDNNIANYPFLQELLSKDLPVNVVEGLPVLEKDLSLKNDELTDDDWKHNARKRLWMMGPLAGLELGPDALNLMGARQGAVRVAKALRTDMNNNKASAARETEE